MSRARCSIAVVVVLVWGLFVPVAMASSGCLLMCDDPCGLMPVVASAPVTPAVIASVTAAHTDVVASVPTVRPSGLEPPPK
jgi:hypothetical protein